MKYLFTFIFGVLLIATTDTVQAQRSIGGRTVVLDNGPGNTLTIVYNGEGSGSLDFPPEAELPNGEEGNTLRHNGEDWEASSNLQNTGSITGMPNAVGYHITTVMSDTVLGDLNYYVMVNSIAEEIEVTLPPAVHGRVIVVRDIAADKQGFGTSIIPDGDDTIDGDVEPFPLNNFFSGFTLVADGSEWKIINLFWSFL